MESNMEVLQKTKNRTAMSSSDMALDTTPQYVSK
jgi:hypothetical protein